ncbi:MAG: DUF2939 domain-containing protein [Acidobacteriota bacterium]|nr:MAG: DUF2939 domain-containing protein [Acidobacteriota bacterium]
MTGNPESRFEVVIEDKGSSPVLSAAADAERRTEKRAGALKALAIIAVILSVSAVVAAAAGFLYWRSLVDSPQYALAELVEAAHRDDQEKIAELVDVDSVVENFVPQVTEKAIELYGRGLPPETIKKAQIVATPILTVVKARARSELPGLLRERTSRLKNVPFWGLVVGADRYLEIEIDGDSAIIRSGREERPLELTMKRSGDVWRVTEVRDEELANKIAGKIGQELILIAKEAGEGKIEDVGRRLGIDGIGDLLKQAEEIFK